MGYIGDVTTELCVSHGEWCGGPVRWREPLSENGDSFPRCDVHWEQRKASEQQIRRRYPQHPPRDWSPLDAGESWDEQDY